MTRKSTLGEAAVPSPATVSSRIWSRAVRLLVLALFSIYAAALLIAAWPDGEDFGPARPIHQASRDLFDILRTRSASYVFSGKRGKWKRKSLCIVAVGTDAAGNQTKLYETYPNCEVPSVRIFEDTSYVLLMRTGNPREMRRFLGAGKKKGRKLLGKLQQSSRLDRVSKYFCDSMLVERGPLSDLQRVDLIWDARQIHYDTSEIHRDLLHVHAYDCQRKQRIRRPGDTYSVESNERVGPHLTVAQKSPREDKNMRSRKSGKGKRSNKSEQAEYK